MKSTLLATLLAVCLALPAFAQTQTQSIGIMTGVTQSSAEGYGTSFPANSFEIFYTATTDLAVDVEIKAGRVRADNGDFIGIANSPESVEIQYVDLMTSYKFWEPWGSTTLALGPGAYKVSHAGVDQTQFGVTAGVGSEFPVTRRFSFVADIGWHWVGADKNFSFINVNGGIRLKF